MAVAEHTHIVNLALARANREAYPQHDAAQLEADNAREHYRSMEAALTQVALELADNVVDDGCCLDRERLRARYIELRVQTDAAEQAWDVAQGLADVLWENGV